jgi:CGNR zinc finger
VVRSQAPGRLEQIRTLLNTWRVPHGTRVPVDDLADMTTSPQAWRSQLPDIPAPDPSDLAELINLRAALRAGLGKRAPGELQTWLDRYPVTVALGEQEPITYLPAERGAVEPGAVAHVLAGVVDAVANDRWPRLKACPDCRHVFFDHSRNRSRTWCGMYAGAPDGRACGSIAKVRAYRERRRQQDGVVGPPDDEAR